jgi:tetratricopeptide (TPR) repeat protein
VASNGGHYVVEKVSPDAPEAASIHAGNRLLSWRRGDGTGAPTGGRFDRTFAYEDMVADELAQGDLLVELVHDGKSSWIPLPSGGLEVRPSLESRLERLVERARLAQEGGDPLGASAILEAALPLARPAVTRVWLLFRAARRVPPARERALLERAAFEAGGDRSLVARVERRQSSIFLDQDDLAGAGVLLHRLVERGTPETLTEALDWFRLDNVDSRFGPPGLAVGDLRCALAVQERLAPDSPIVGATLNAIGMRASERGEFREAEGSLRKSLEIMNRFVPSSNAVATILGNLGIAARRQSRLKEAAEWHRQSLEIREKNDPGDAARR